jgi:hypothetical protein
MEVSPDQVNYLNKTAAQMLTLANGVSENGMNFGYSIYLGIR